MSDDTELFGDLETIKRIFADEDLTSEEKLVMTAYNINPLASIRKLAVMTGLNIPKVEQCRKALIMKDWLAGPQG